MLIIGLTGGIGSGKSYVADLFQAKGVGIVDTDVVAHHLTAPHGVAMPAIRARFGADFVRPDGALDRVKMRQLVFNDAAAKSDLEAITHPLIRSETQRLASEIIAAGQAPYLMLVVPLLIESGQWQSRVQRVLVVDCPVAQQIERVMQRSGLTQAEVEAIIARQASRAERLAAAHDVIDNSGTRDALLPQVDALHQQYCQLR